MATPSKPPVDHQDCTELQKLRGRVCDGNAPKLATRKATGKVASGVRRLSTISEQEPAKLDTDPSSHDPLCGSEWGGSSISMCSNKFNSSSSCLSFDDSYQPDTGDDCAALLLACLHCRFHDFVVLLPGACERAVQRCFPSYRHIVESAETDQQGQDCCNYKLELDCNFCSSCQDAGELIELAMEISEVCYH